MNSQEGSIIGIDPGLAGAVAVLTTPGHTLIVRDTPTLSIGGKKRMDLHQFDNILRELVLMYEPRLAVVEDVHSMPKQGVASSFTFGHVAGATQMALVSHRVPLRLVPPGAWKRLLGLTRDKDDSRRKASQLFPAFAHLWARAKDDGRAEAALLAYYGSRLPA